jgi:hypothetical protein
VLWFSVFDGIGRPALICGLFLLKKFLRIMGVFGADFDEGDLSRTRSA